MVIDKERRRSLNEIRAISLFAYLNHQGKSREHSDSVFPGMDELRKVRPTRFIGSRTLSTRKRKEVAAVCKVGKLI